MALIEEIAALGPVGAFVLFLLIGVFGYKLWQADQTALKGGPGLQEQEEKDALALSDKLRREEAEK